MKTYKDYKKEIFERDNFICANCGIDTKPAFDKFKNGEVKLKQVKDVYPTLDHIIPKSYFRLIAYRFSDTRYFQTLCGNCNNKKANTLNKKDIIKILLMILFDKTWISNR